MSDYRALSALTAGLRDDNLNIRVNQKDMSSIWCLQSPVTMVAGETRTFTMAYVGQATVSSPVATVYKGTSDGTTVCMPSGTASASGNVVTLKPMTGVVGGETYIVAVTTTIGGNTDIRKFEVAAKKATEVQGRDIGDTWCLESPVVMIAGETRGFTITYLGQTAVSSPVATVYKGTTNVTSTVMPSETAASASGNVVTLKQVTALVGGETYVVCVATTINPNSDIRKFEIKCVKASDRQ